jgi:multiple sugar transport system ATP-binding protein
MAALTLQNLGKVFPGSVCALEGLDLHAAHADRVVLAGPSGSGKTTALRLIAGLDVPTTGSIAIDGRVVNHVAPQHRDVAMVFQHQSLYPHLNVYANLAFGLRLRRIEKSEIHDRILEAAAVLGITDLLDRRTWELSGGEAQRVALGRAMVRRPKILLLDEPLSHLDAALREQMRREIVRLQEECPRTTMIYVTHDQTEAMTIGRRIVLLNNGKVQQIGDPETLYRHPANRFVAAQIGSPAMNFFQGRIKSGGEGLTFHCVGCESRDVGCVKRTGQSPLPLGERAPPHSGGRGEGIGAHDFDAIFSWPVSSQWKMTLTPYRGQDIILGIRPEHLFLEQAAVGEDALRIPAVVDSVESLGAESHIHLRCGSKTFICRTQSNHSVKAGDSLTPAANPERLHFFDPATGNTLERGACAAA